MEESGLTEIIPFICISAIWDQYPEFPSIHQRKWLSLVAAGCCPPSWAQKFTFGGPESLMAVTSLSIDRQEILHFSVRKRNKKQMKLLTDKNGIKEVETEGEATREGRKRNNEMRTEKEREEALNQIWVGGGSYGLEISFEAGLKTGLNSASADYELHILEKFLRPTVPRFSHLQIGGIIEQFLQCHFLKIK